MSLIYNYSWRLKLISLTLKSDDTFLFVKYPLKVTYDVIILREIHYPLIEINDIDSFLADVPPWFMIKLMVL